MNKTQKKISIKTNEERKIYKNKISSFHGSRILANEPK